MSSQSQAPTVRPNRWQAALLAVLGFGLLIGTLIYCGLFPVRMSGLLLVVAQIGLLAWVTGRPPRPALARRLRLVVIWMAPAALVLIVTGLIIHA